MLKPHVHDDSDLDLIPSFLCRACHPEMNRARYAAPAPKPRELFPAAAPAQHAGGVFE